MIIEENGTAYVFSRDGLDAYLAALKAGKSPLPEDYAETPIGEFAGSLTGITAEDAGRLQASIRERLQLRAYVPLPAQSLEDFATRAVELIREEQIGFPAEAA